MMSPAGRENFFNKWWQVVGSIQKTNDLDVHIALLSAPSYAMEVKNKYYSRTKTPHQIIREHIDMFGFMQKNVNALDILIEDAKITLQSWGSPPPSFMLCNSKLTMQVLLFTSEICVCCGCARSQTAISRTASGPPLHAPCTHADGMDRPPLPCPSSCMPHSTTESLHDPMPPPSIESLIPIDPIAHHCANPCAAKDCQQNFLIPRCGLVHCVPPALPLVEATILRTPALLTRNTVPPFLGWHSPFLCWH